MKAYRIITALLTAAVCVTAAAQKKSPQQSYEDFYRRSAEKYNSFRDKANKDYADALRRAWVLYYGEEPVPEPVDTVPPLPIEEYEKPRPEPVIDLEIVIEEEIIIPPPAPQPEPVEPIEEVTVPIYHITPIEKTRPPEPPHIDFDYYGTQLSVRDFPSLRLAGYSHGAIADVWERLSSRDYNNVVVDCLRLREDRNLCDWAYMRMVDRLAKAKFPSDRPMQTLFTAYVMVQSGYDILLCQTDTAMDFMYRCDNTIFNHVYFIMNGVKYYPYHSATTSFKANVCDVPFRGSSQLSMEVTVPRLDTEYSDYRHMSSDRYPGAKADVRVNKSLMDFYSDYPSSALTSDFMSRWAYYANTPLCDEARSTLYPMLRSQTEGLSRLDALNLILNFCQHSLPYGYDDEIWGGDRAFFPDESIYYPLSDCEDHAILFARLVRDILDLPVALIYYPGHLATAVAVDGATGDYVNFKGRRYYICDPTAHGPVGVSMAGMSTDSATAFAVR